MESNIKTHVITPLKGICNTPSELTCNDEQLQQCDGLIYSNGELQPIQKPSFVFKAEGVVLKFVHDFNNTEHGQRYLFAKNETTLVWMHEDDTEPKTIHTFDSGGVIKQIKAIGNTLIVNTATGIGYVLWKEADYKYIGSSIPKPTFHFSMGDEYVYKSKSIIVDDRLINLNHSRPLPDGEKITLSSGIVEENRRVDYNNACRGLYAECKKELSDYGAFSSPFFVRGALEMYDGSYLYITNPVLMYPIIGKNHEYSILYGDDECYIGLSVCGSYLHVIQNTDYSEFSDLIKDVVIFATKQADIYDERHKNSSGSMYVCFETWYEYGVTHGVPDIPDFGTFYYGDRLNKKKFRPHLDNGVFMDSYYQLKPNYRIIEEYEKLTNFYEINRLGIKRVTPNVDLSVYGKPLYESDYSTNALDDIVNQPKLTHDDYFAWSGVISNTIETLNRRLIESDISRSFFSGFSHFVNIRNRYEENDVWKQSQFLIELKLLVEGGEKIIKEIVWSDEAIANGFWFYYPDPRAKRVRVFKLGSNGWQNLWEAELKEHPFLNGAYVVQNIAKAAETGIGISYAPALPDPKLGSPDPEKGPITEYLGNYIRQSNVNNPFVFNAEGENSIGSGHIIGIAGLTTALSQDAYKVSTTLCFTTQGIWAIRSNDEGVFSSIAPPFSREVCTNPDSITMTDNAVFFVSKKGLMCVTGASEASVICVSEALRGNDNVGFNKFIQKATIAYDYVNNNLMLYDGNEVWAYGLKSGTFATCSDWNMEDNVPLHLCNDYPDSLVQYSDGSIYSLYNKEKRESDDNRYEGTLESRAMKLSGSTYLKSIRRIRHLMTLAEQTSFSFVLYASNDLKSWYKLNSLRGKPYRFFKFRYEFYNMAATDIFSGLMLEAQTRQTDKPR